MQRHSKILLATALGGAIVAVACSFPDVTYFSGTDDASSAVDTGAPEEDTGTDAETDASEIPDSGEPPPIIEAGVPTEGGVVEDASACDGDDAGIRRCDCDEDGWLVQGCDAGVVDPTKKGSDKAGWDCDDHNRDIRPDQDVYFGVSTPDGGWDWNCNGKIDKAYPDGYQCISLGGALGCSPDVGFKQDKACGDQGTVYRCVANGLLSCTSQTHTASGVQLCH